MMKSSSRLLSETDRSTARNVEGTIFKKSIGTKCAITLGFCSFWRPFSQPGHQFEHPSRHLDSDGLDVSDWLVLFGISVTEKCGELIGPLEEEKMLCYDFGG